MAGQWMRERSRTIRSLEELEKSIVPLQEERDFFLNPPSEGLDFAVSPYYLSLVGAGEDDPIRRQCIPLSAEGRVLPYESPDPLQDLRHSPVSRLVHRYRDRALLMVTDECAVYCRHCFRRHFSGGRRGYLSASELRGVEDYLKEHGEIKELILSGGDPLTLSDRRIEELIRRIRTLRRDLVLRIATRIPVVLPSRISASLVSILSDAAPVFLVSQFNHPREINEASGAALRSLLEGGVSLLNQAVLLRGVNDDVDTLEELFGALVSRQVFSYYLFQADLAAGTSHLRVSIRRGFELMRELRRRLSGVSLPVYALDLPGGGGKIPLTESYLLADGASRGGEGEAVAYETEEGVRFFRFTSPEGGVFEYPDESSPRTAFE